MKRLIAIKRQRLKSIEDHHGRTRGHIGTHLDVAMSIRRWKINESAIKAHDSEIVAYHREIVAHDREIMTHDREIVGDTWSLRSSSDGPQLK